MIKILIITYNWPPRNAIGSHRPYSWAKYWSLFGAKVTVLTAKKTPFDAPLDLSLPKLEGVEVIEVPYQNLFPKSKLIGSPTIKRWLKRIKLIVNKSTSTPIDVRKSWEKQVKKRIDQGVFAGYDVLVSTYGPASTHLIACYLKSKHPEVKWVADYRDLWSNNHVTSLTKTQRALYQKMETESVGAFSDVITTVSKDLSLSLHSLHKIKCHVITNGFDISKAQLEENLNISRPRKLAVRVVHTGTVYEGHRDPTPILEVLKEMYENNEIHEGDVTLDFYGMNIEPVRRLARNLKYSRFIRIFGHVSRDLALEAQKDASLLLLLESKNSNAKGVLTGKIFEYISSGVPVLSVGSHGTSEISELLDRTGTGLAVTEDKYLIKKAINAIMNGESLSWYLPKIDEIMMYSREFQAKKMFYDVLVDGS